MISLASWVDHWFIHQEEKENIAASTEQRSVLCCEWGHIYYRV